MAERITSREARLRTAAIACLAGLAVVELTAVPYALVQGTHIAALAVGVIAAAVRVAVVLARAGAAMGAVAWRAASALSGLVLAGWVVTRAASVPGVAEDAGHWTSVPGVAAAGLAVVVAALATLRADRPPVRRPARTLVGAAAVCVALAPGAAVMLVALGPAPGGAGGAHGPHGARPAASPGRREALPPRAGPAASFRPGFGGHAGHYVYPNARPPHLPAWALALALGAAGAFASSAGGALRRRGAPAPAAAPARSSLGSPRGVRPRAGALAGVVAVLAGACALAAPAPVASAHARLVRAEPPNLARLSSTPDRVVLAFSEPVQVVRPGDVRLLDHEGQAARTGGAHTAPRGGRVVTLWLRSRLRPGSWTVRYHVLSADAHTLSGAVVFAAGGAVLLPPAGGASAGPSETSAWAVDSRFAELVALGGLLALLAFRWLVWGPALLRAPGLGDAERTRAALEGRRLFWTAFWTAAAVAGLAEAAVLAVKTDLVFATGLWGALAHPAAAERLVSASRFGDLLGGRGALLCAIAMLSFWTWLAEPAMAEPPRGAGGRALPAVVLALLSAGALGLIAAQGHASQAPLPALSIAFDAVHLGAVAVWAGGLACLGAVLRAAPRVLPAGGPSLAAAVLGRFSRLAAGAVAVIAATGLARAAGELAAPSDLWATPYGRTLILKTLLLAPVAVLAIRHRRAIAALAVCGRPARARLRRVARDLRAELAVAMTIVLVAAVLVGQLPGRA